MNNAKEIFENKTVTPPEIALKRPLWATLLKFLVYIPATLYFLILLMLNFRISSGILPSQFVIWLTLFALGFAILATSSESMGMAKKWVALLPILLFIAIYGTPL